MMISIHWLSWSPPNVRTPGHPCQVTLTTCGSSWCWCRRSRASCPPRPSWCRTGRRLPRGGDTWDTGGPRTGASSGPGQIATSASEALALCATGRTFPHRWLFCLSHAQKRPPMSCCGCIWGHQYSFAVKNLSQLQFYALSGPKMNNLHNTNWPPSYITYSNPMQRYEHGAQI